MRRFSPQWFDALRLRRFSREWPGVSGPDAPVMPWVTPPLHPFIRKLFSTRGVVREFEPGEWLFPRVQVRSFMYVEEGLTGRILASLDGQPGAGAMALSPDEECLGESQLGDGASGNRPLSGALPRARAGNPPQRNA